MPVVSPRTSASSPTIANAYIWTALGSSVKYLFGFGISMLLARLLTPADYGLIGMVLVFTSFLSVIQEGGLAHAIIFFKNDEHTVLSTHHTVNMVASIVLAATLAALAPLIAKFYQMLALSVVTQVMGLSFLLNGLRSVSQNVMTKQFRFREIAIIETVAVFIAAAVAVAMAASGFGVWSLVTNMLLGSAI